MKAWLLFQKWKREREEQHESNQQSGRQVRLRQLRLRQEPREAPPREPRRTRPHDPRVRGGHPPEADIPAGLSGRRQQTHHRDGHPEEHGLRLGEEARDQDAGGVRAVDLQPLLVHVQARGGGEGEGGGVSLGEAPGQRAAAQPRFYVRTQRDSDCYGFAETER